MHLKAVLQALSFVLKYALMALALGPGLMWAGDTGLHHYPALMVFLVMPVALVAYGAAGYFACREKGGLEGTAAVAVVMAAVCVTFTFDGTRGVFAGMVFPLLAGGAV